MKPVGTIFLCFPLKAQESGFSVASNSNLLGTWSGKAKSVWAWPATMHSRCVNLPSPQTTAVVLVPTSVREGKLLPDWRSTRCPAPHQSCWSAQRLTSPPYCWYKGWPAPGLLLPEIIPPAWWWEHRHPWRALRLIWFTDTLGLTCNCCFLASVKFGKTGRRNTALLSSAIIFSQFINFTLSLAYLQLAVNFRC